MFITFEGIEGSGKTTQAGLLAKQLEKNGVRCVLTKEPGTIFSKECQQIRQLLLSPENNLSSTAELFLYLADRAQHVESCIKPALSDNKWVVADRYSWSTYVYQGYGRNLINELGDLFKDMLSYSANSIWPDLTFIMDLPAEIGLERAKKSNTEFKGGDRIERAALSFHKTLRTGFLDVARKSNKCVILDARKPIKELHEEVTGYITNLITPMP